MAATGKTPILLYGSTTATNAPVAGNLTNSSDGCEIAINVADKNLFFKDSTNAVNTVPIRQSSASSNGWLSSTDWSTFNSKQPAGSYALTTGTLAQFAATTSAQLAGVISDETGSGSLVFATSPTLTTPVINGFTGNTAVVNIGSGQIYKEAGGAVGIGTTSPSTYGKLAVSGNAIAAVGDGNYFAIHKTDGTRYGYIQGTAGLLKINAEAGASNVIGFYTSGAQAMQVGASGGVSIGNTTNPGAGNLYVTNSGLFGTATNNGAVSAVKALSTTTAPLYASDAAPFGGLGRKAVSQLYMQSDSSSDVLDLVVGSSSYTGVMQYCYNGTNSSTGYYFVQYRSGANGVTCQIRGDGNVYNANGVFAAISDKKLKENIVDATPKLDDLLKVKVRNFNLIADESKLKQIGVIADELQEVFPGLVEENEEGIKSVKYSIFIPMLIKSIQEQQETIVALQARIESLENK